MPSILLYPCRNLCRFCILHHRLRVENKRCLCIFHNFHHTQNYFDNLFHKHLMHCKCRFCIVRNLCSFQRIVHLVCNYCYKKKRNIGLKCIECNFLDQCNLLNNDTQKDIHPEHNFLLYIWCIHQYLLCNHYSNNNSQNNQLLHIGL